MGANIENVDYQDIVNKANQISNLSVEANTAISDAYQKMKDMSNDWYGNSYDKFAKVANSFIEQLNKCFRACIVQIPTELIAKARSYAQSNLSDLGGAMDASVKNLTDISLTNKGTKLKFVSSNVSNDQVSIENSFKIAETKCDEISSTLQSIDWSSVSGSRNKQELKKYLTNIKNIIGTIKLSLKQIINNQQATIDLIEGAQEAVEAGKELTEDIIDAAKSAADSLATEISDAVAATWESLTGGR